MDWPIDDDSIYRSSTVKLGNLVMACILALCSLVLFYTLMTLHCWPVAAMAFSSWSKRVLGGTWRASKRRRLRRGVRDAEGRDAKGVEGWGMGTGYPPPQPTRGFVGSSVVSSPSGVRGRAPAKTILLLSKRVRTPLVATFVENNVVHSRPLVEKKWVCSMGRFWSIEATASVIVCSSCVGKLTKVDLDRSFEVLNAILHFDCRFCTWQVS